MNVNGDFRMAETGQFDNQCRFGGGGNQCAESWIDIASQRVSSQRSASKVALSTFSFCLKRDCLHGLDSAAFDRFEQDQTRRTDERAGPTVRSVSSRKQPQRSFRNRSTIRETGNLRIA